MRTVQAVFDLRCRVVAFGEFALGLVACVVALGIAADQHHEYGENRHYGEQHFKG